MRIKSRFTVAIASLGLVGTMAVPADAAFVSICPTSDHVTFSPALDLSTVPLPGSAVTLNTAAVLGLCRRINDDATVVPVTPAPVLTGTATGGCVLAVLGGSYFQGVLVGGSVWVTVDQGAGFTAAVATKVLVPNVICNETSANGFGVGVMVG